MANPPKWNVGGSGPDGSTIKFIYACTDTALVWETSTGENRYFIDADQHTDKQRAVLRTYNALEARVAGLLEGDERKSARDELASILGATIECTDTEEIGPAFQHMVASLDGKAVTLYGSTCLVVTLFVTAILVFFNWVLGTPETFLYLKCIFVATLGALASVLQQLQKLVFPAHLDRKTLVAYATGRVLLGAILGLFFTISVKAEILLGFASKNDLALIAFSFIAGFSERFVVNQVEYFENKARMDATPSDSTKA